MKQYRLVNNLMGWLAFAVAAFTYCMTVEPTASFWDCPEFITTAAKMEVGHPPGAPFFMLTGNFFTQFTNNPENVALCINIMSAVLSAFCILFLFWSITHLARKLICTDGQVQSVWQTVLIMGAGLTGALAYTWSDTFWYSAVEAEVYGYSSMFTALVFWLILKWEDHADEPHSDRWIILICYLTGLSIGVHLLNLLCLPAIALIYYYRKNPDAQLKGSLVALAVSALLVVAVLYGLVPGIVKVGGVFELFFVNTLGMPFNTGLIVYILVLIGVVLYAIHLTYGKNRTRMVVFYLASVALLGVPFIGSGKGSVILGLALLVALTIALFKKVDGQYLLRKRFLNTSLLCMLVMMIGYSSYAVIMVRSVQNTPMDQNSPEDIFTLGSYLNREQYGRTPLLHGETYMSELAYDADGNYQVKEKTAYKQHINVDGEVGDKYDSYQSIEGYEFFPSTKMLFPRVHSKNHAGQYNSWFGMNPDPENPDSWKKPVAVPFVSTLPYFKEVKFDIPLPEEYRNAYTGDTYEATTIIPTQWANLDYFLSYQVNFMYWRYFLWNFAGRQNDVQGLGDLQHGNFLTGISFIDNARLGDQNLLPDELKNNKGRNVFYCLPLLLGLLGFFWQAFKGQRGVQQFWVVFFLFFMTGLAIVLYLNQTPSQPRERDYAYAGSFYAFAIWIGLGVVAMGDGLRALRERYRQNWITPAVAAIVPTLLCLLVPVQMVSQTWDDHDRSGRYAARDFGMNYLATLPDQGMPIIYTNGDNDTFPLWYAHEVEGFRTDTRVCNLSYLGTDWYIDQMKRPAHLSAGLPIAWTRAEYDNHQGHNFIRVKDERADLDAYAAAHPGADPYELSWLIDNYARTKGYLPTSNFHVKVNKAEILKSGMLLPNGPDSIPEYMEISLGDKKVLDKSEMMIYEMLARNDWKRPIYMSVTLGQGNMAGLEDYLVLEGLAYRLTPFKVGLGTIDADKMYDNLINRFKYGNVAAEGIYLDETVRRMCGTHRHMFTQLTVALLEKGDKERALKVMQKCKEVLPQSNVPYELSDYGLIQLWSDLGQVDEASRIAKDIARQSQQYFTWADDLTSGHMLYKSASVRREYRQHLACLKDLKKMVESDGLGETPKINLNEDAVNEINAVLTAAFSSAQMQNTYESILNSYEANWAQLTAAISSLGMSEPTEEEVAALVYGFQDLYDQIVELSTDPGIQQGGFAARLSKLKKEMEDSPFGQEMQKAFELGEIATTE